MHNIEQRRENIKKVVGVGAILIVGFLVAPFVFLAIKGIVGLAAAFLVGSALLAFMPWYQMKIANWRVKAIEAEARENPIETMVNLLAAKKEAYQVFKANVETAATAEKDFEQKCKEFSKQYPHRAPEFTKQLAAMHNLVERKKIALRQAKQSLEDGDNKLTEMRAYWQMSQAAQAANKAAGMDTGDQFEKLKADTAVDAVFESMNRAFAELEVADALDSNVIQGSTVVASQDALSYNEPVTLEVTDVRVKQNVKL